MLLQALRTKDLEPLGERPVHRFRLRGLERPKSLSPRLSVGIEGVVSSVRELLKKAGLPEGLGENPYYSALLLEEIPDPDDPIKGTIIERNQNIWSLLPFRPNFDQAYENLERVVDHLIQYCKEKESDLSEEELIRQNIRRAIFILMDEGIHGIHHYPLNRMDVLDQENPEKQGRFSMEFLRQAVITVQKRVLHEDEGEDEGEVIGEEDALIHLLGELGILDPQEIFDVLEIEAERQNLERMHAEYLTKAWTLYTAVQKTVNELMDRKLVEGVKEVNGISDLETSTSLRQFSIFHLLEVVFTGRVSGFEEYKDRTFTETDLHEAQTIAALFYTFCETSENLSRKHAGRLVPSLERQLRNGIFEQDGSYRRPGNLYAYEDGKFVVKADKISPELTRLQAIPGFEQIDEEQRLVSFVYFRRKGRTSSVLRRTNRSPEMPAHLIPDMIAGRMILWGFSLSDLIHNPRSQDYLRAVTQKAGESLGLQYNPAKDNKREDLAQGEFCIENKLADPYPSFRVYGCLKRDSKDEMGIHCEIQMIPRDVHQMVEVPDSPISHATYERLRYLETFLVYYPDSMFKVQRKIVQGELVRMRKAREEALEALRETAHLSDS